MPLAFWIALTVGLTLLALGGWLILTTLWLVGHTARVLVTQRRAVREPFRRWCLPSLAMALIVSFSGIWIADEPVVPADGPTDAQMSLYRTAILAVAIEIWLYLITAVAALVLCTVGCVVLASMTGGSQANSEPASVDSDGS